jgi:hypothetical protein
MDTIQDWHSRFVDGTKWRLTDDGIEVFGDGSVKRTSGKPDTIKRIWLSYGKEISTYSAKYNVPVEIIIANIATESGGKTSAYREEPGYKSDVLTPGKVSAGLMQTLVSTAIEATGNKKIRARDLFEPDLSIHAGTSYIAQQAFKTNLDPVLVPIAYNAGGIYYQKGNANRFKMRMYPIGTSEHVDRYILWFNDCRYAIKTKYIDVGLSLTMNL